MTHKRDIEDLIDHRSRRREKALLIGRVSKVHPKESNDKEEGNIEVNVITRTFDHELRKVPVAAYDHSGHVYCPQEDDWVVVQWAMGRGREPVVVGGTPTNVDRMPHALPGHWRHEFEHEAVEDNLYLEAEPKDSTEGDAEVLRMSEKPDGITEPTSWLGLDRSNRVVDYESGTDSEAGVEIPGTDEGDATFIRGVTDGHIDIKTTDDGYVHFTLDDNDFILNVEEDDNGGGDIEILTEKGDIDMISEKGDVTVKTEEGDIDTVTEEGDVTVKSNKGDVDTVSEKGDVTVESKDGDLTLKTGNGDLTVDVAGNANVTTDGDCTVDADGALNLNGSSVTVNTDSGPKEVAYNDHTHNYADADTDEGGAGGLKTTSPPNEKGTDTTIG